MKCKGVIHPELMEALTSLGHTDSFMLCDAGFPIPVGAQRIDLALTPGVPSFRACLNSILQEVIVEAFSMAEEMKTYNPETFDYLMALFPRQKRTIASQSAFLPGTQPGAVFRAQRRAEALFQHPLDSRVRRRAVP
jgi:D-ribose pyranase